MNEENDRTDLTAEETEIVGMPGDLVSEEPVPARRRSNTVMVSIRVDRSVFDGLSRLAEAGGRTFSETAREALRRFVGEHGAADGYPQRESSWGRGARRVSENPQLAWSDEDLRAALDRYLAASQGAGMREKAWRSYADYARRFLAWRTGNYRPRGVLAGTRPVPRTAASTEKLRRQAELYARHVEAAGRAQATVDTYYRHALFFIRWLEGDFEPGARLYGLR
jgi:hypothetical protein